jgi:hypothetical protein
MKPLKPLVAVMTLATILVACGPSAGGLGSVPTVPPSPGPSAGQGEPDLTPAPSPPAPSPTSPVPTAPAPTAPAPTSVPSQAPTGSAPPATPRPNPPTPAPTAAPTTVVRAYFYLGGEPGSAGLVAVLREVPRTRAVATAAVNELLGGPTAAESGQRTITSAIPDGTRLLGLAIEDGIATVDLSREFETGGGSASVLNRLSQVVYTLTQFPTVTGVIFKLEGEVVTVFSGEGVVLDGPVGRADYEELLPAVFVDRPVWRAALGNPGRIVGNANVFEATFMITVLDGRGRVVYEDHATATCGTGCRGTFDVTVRYDVDRAQWGTLRVWVSSARDGSPENVREYPVWLSPAS